MTIIKKFTTPTYVKYQKNLYLKILRKKNILFSIFLIIYIYRENIKIGHFTQLVRDQAYVVGCAMVQFEKDGWYIWLRLFIDQYFE